MKQSVVGTGTYSTYLVKLVQATGNTNWWGTFWWAVCHVCDGTTHLELGDQVTAPGRIRVITLCMATAGCFDGTSGDCSTFQYEVTNQGGGLGGVQTVTSNVRPMPTKNGLGRVGPFRMQDMNGVRLLYSSSTDRLCATGVNDGFPGSEIIVTEVNN